MVARIIDFSTANLHAKVATRVVRVVEGTTFDWLECSYAQAKHSVITINSMGSLSNIPRGRYLS